MVWTRHKNGRRQNSENDLEWNAEGRRKDTGKKDGWNREEYEQIGIDGRRCARQECSEK